MQDDGGSLVCRRCGSRATGGVPELWLGGAGVDPSRSQPDARGDRGGRRPSGWEVTGESESLPDCDVSSARKPCCTGPDGPTWSRSSTSTPSCSRPGTGPASRRWRCWRAPPGSSAPAAVAGGCWCRRSCPHHEVLLAVLHADPSRAVKVELEPAASCSACRRSLRWRRSRAPEPMRSPPRPGLEASSSGDACCCERRLEALGAAISATPRPKGPRLRIAVDLPDDVPQCRTHGPATRLRSLSRWPGEPYAGFGSR